MDWEKTKCDGLSIFTSGNYMIPDETVGVWLADMPLDANENTKGDTVLFVDLVLSEEQIAQFEWIEEGAQHRS